MKHSLSFTLGALALSTNLWAQPTPSYTSMAVLTKATGTGCGPCGSWGWTTMESAITTHGSTTLIMAAYDPYYNYNGAGESPLHNNYSIAWLKNVSVRYFPDFSVMSKASSSPFTTDIQAQLAKTQNIGMNFQAWVEGSNVKVARFVQAKTPVTGSYSISTILLEDGVKHIQASQTGAVPHHYVFRAMPNTNQRGDVLPAAALNGSLWSDTVTIAIRSETPAWNKNNFKIGLVLWQGTTMQNAYTRPVSETYKTFGVTSSSSQVSSSSLVVSSSSIKVSSSSVVSSSSIKVSSSSIVANTLNTLAPSIQHSKDWIRSQESGITMILRDAQGKKWGSFDGQLNLQGLPSGAWMLEIQKGTERNVYRFETH